MKKFLAVLFSVSLLMCSFAPACFAEEESTDPEGTLFYEFEDLAAAAEAGYVVTADNAGSLSVKYASNESYWATISASSDPSATLKFTVPEGGAGIYKVQYAAMKRTDTKNLSNMSFYVNDGFVGDNENNCTAKQDLTRYATAGDGSATTAKIYPWGYASMALFEGSFNCSLKEGENTLRLDVSYLPDPYSGNWKFFADYIKFIPTTEEDMPLEGITIEAEDMTSGNVETITGASGGKWVGHQSTDATLSTIKKWVRFPESRYYDLTYVTSKWFKSVSEISLYLGERKIGSNKEDAEIGTNVQENYTGSETNAAWTKKWCNMFEYKKQIWIDAGIYPLEIQIACCEDTNYATTRKYFIDYISFTLPDDTVVTYGESYMAKVTFEKSVSGVALMAAYNGNQLVGFSATDLSEAKQYIETTLQTDETVTKVKVFVWDGITSCIPQIACKELTVTY